MAVTPPTDTPLASGPPSAPPARNTAWVFPVSAPQRQICFLQQLEPESPAYNIPFAFRVRGPLDEGALERALLELVRRHDALRTGFLWNRGEPTQLVRAKADPTLERVDLSGRPPAAAEAEAQRLADEEARRPFDMGRPPLVRASLVRIAEDDAVFLLTLHHAVVDHVSVLQVGRELETLYGAFAAGRPSPVAAPGLQYPDFAVWQRDQLAGEAARGRAAEWVEALSGPDTLTVLPADRGRPAMESYRGAELAFRFPADLSADLDRFCRSAAVTPFMTVLAALKTLLARYGGQDVVTVGCPFANRTRPELESVLGCFINTLPLRTDLGGDPSFREAVGRVRATTLAAHPRQDIPFDTIVQELRPDRDFSHNPLFQTSFTFQEAPLRLALPGLEVTSWGIHSGSSKFDLSLWMWREGEATQGLLEYNTDLFEEASAHRIVGHLETLLAGAVAAPDRPLSELPVLTRRELELLDEWQGPAMEAEGPATAHALVEARVTATPAATALEWNGASVTYGELERRANRLAHHLVAMGAGPGVSVALLLERSDEMVVALLAVLKAGAFYVPLDPTHPGARLRYILDEASPAVVVTTASEAGILEGWRGAVLRLDVEADAIRTRPQHRPEASVGADDLAYVIYTSGSTGKPKGVQVPHGAVVNLLRSMAREPGLRPGDRLFAVTTLSFDISVLEILLPLSVGATSIVASSDAAQDGVRLMERLEESRATVMQATPATWRLLVEAGWDGSSRLRVLCGGEALTPELAGKLVALAPEVWNLYGPTETTVWSTRRRLAPRDGVPIGRPIENTLVRVLDGRGRPVPVNVPGELHIGGAGLTRGYLDRPDLTAERYVEVEGVGPMYRTGDMVRWGPDGTLHYLNRRDNQVKVRGFRIELGEIESALLEHPSLQAAAAGVRNRGMDDRRLVTWVVPREGERVTASTVRRHLKALLPAYMIPRHVTVLGQLPLNTNGKIDRAALPDPFAASQDHDEVVPPSTPAETLLSRVCCEVLGLDSAGINHRFFDLGGHSLLAMRLVAAVEERTGVRLAPRLLAFETLGQVAARLEEGVREARA